MYVLHYCPDNASFAVRIVLEELGLPYRAELLDRDAGAQDSTAYREIHPLGLVPAINTPDGPIFETAAILLWLADKHGALAPAPTSSDRAAFLKWFFFTSSNIHPTVLHMIYAERYSGSDSATPAFAAQAKQRMESYLGLLDAMIAQEQPDWLSPHAPSILGYYVSMLCRWLKYFRAGNPLHIDFAKYPGLRAVAAGLEMRPAALRAANQEGLGATIFTNPDYPEE